MKQSMKLNMKQVQKLILTPELRQSIELLAVNALDLSQLVNEISLANPTLVIEDRQDESYDSEVELKKEKRELLDRIERYDYSGYYPQSSEDDENVSPLNYAHDDMDLIDDLRFQFNCCHNCKKAEDIAEIIFSEIDANGYLKSSVAELSKNTGFTELEIRKVKEVINSLEPHGVGAENLIECLLIQCDHIGPADQITKDIINFNLEDIAENRLNKISTERKISLEDTKKRIEYIKSLNPKPGASYSENRAINYIYPEAYIHQEGDEYLVYMENEYVPKLSISNEYKNMIKEADGETLEYLKKNIDSAEWLIEGIKQRESTIERILNYLVEFQKDFIKYGKKHLKPLSQKDLAQELDISESTVSRVVNDKYVCTPQGIIEIKDFFSVDTGNHISSMSAHTVIKEIIDNEDKSKPLSDSKIVEVLEDRGIDIARRTVAKYRDEMNIPKSSIRKEY